MECDYPSREDIMKQSIACTSKSNPIEFVSSNATNAEMLY